VRWIRIREDSIAFCHFWGKGSRSKTFAYWNKKSAVDSDLRGFHSFLPDLGQRKQVENVCLLKQCGGLGSARIP
jgi:hypothetical protein